MWRLLSIQTKHRVGFRMPSPTLPSGIASTAQLLARGRPVIAAASPLRSVKTDSDNVAAQLKAQMVRLPSLVGSSTGLVLLAIACPGAAGLRRWRPGLTRGWIRVPGRLGLLPAVLVGGTALRFGAKSL